MISVDERIGWFYKDENKFFKMDFSHLKEKEIIELLLHVAVVIEDVENEAVFLTDVSGSDLNATVVSHMAILSKDMQPLVKRSAVIGITGIQSALFSLYRALTSSKARLFVNAEEAFKYLFKN